MEYGYEEGEVCKRNGCKGVIELRPVENCSCHINPPCGACTAIRENCPECGYEGKDNFVMNDFVISPNNETGVYRSWEPRPLDSSKIDWRSKEHTHFTMIKEGVYPQNSSRADVEKEVRGTFGGRFQYFENGKFKYVAYTD